ncbi:hypothetical protein TYRP_009228 [Tyrophagus putrescentiae]|nr:hypothetical protein TYRP_009228 [Tyrophagus putrescentiae]
MAVAPSQSPAQRYLQRKQTATMISRTIVLLSVLALVHGQGQPAAYGSQPAAAEPPHPAPEPYSFTYESPNEDGSSSARQETGDANGRITGFYIIKGADGQDRRVDYYADETGFHAEISTNEIGTVTHEAAAASYRSSAPSVADLAAAWEASGANRASGSGASASSSRSQYSASTSSGSSSSGGGSGRAAGAYGAGGVGAGGAAASAAGGGGSFRTSSSIFSTEPGPTVTPEGFVLVKASAARTAGLNVIGPEITNFQGLQGLQQQSGPAGAARPFGGARPSGRK